MPPNISILVPHFQTPKLTLLCLRLLRRRTIRNDYETIVIDNGSADDSVETLRRVEWIRLLQRKPEPGERPARSHGLALNVGVENARSPNILIMHTDTMILRGDWLDFLLRELDSAGPSCGSVGSWKMESHGAWKRLGKWVEERVRVFRGRPRPGASARYIRSHCALYRKEAILRHSPMFVPSEGRSAGEELHLALGQIGFGCRFVGPNLLGRYVRHLNHATMALNEQFGRDDRNMPRTRARTLARLDSFFRDIEAEKLLSDTSLDAA